MFLYSVVLRLTQIVSMRLRALQMLGSNTSSENCDEPTDILLITGLFTGLFIEPIAKCQQQQSYTQAIFEMTPGFKPDLSH